MQTMKQTRAGGVRRPDEATLTRLLRRGTAEVTREADLVRLLTGSDAPLRIM